MNPICTPNKNIRWNTRQEQTRPFSIQSCQERVHQKFGQYTSDLDVFSNGFQKQRAKHHFFEPKIPKTKYRQRDGNHFSWIAWCNSASSARSIHWQKHQSVFPGWSWFFNDTKSAMASVTNWLLFVPFINMAVLIFSTTFGSRCFRARLARAVFGLLSK